MNRHITVRLTRTLTLLFGIAMGLAAPGNAPAGQPLDLPDFGSSADTVMSSSQERRLGRAFMQSVRKSLPVSDDPLLSDYVASLGNDLVGASGTGPGTTPFSSSTNPSSTPSLVPAATSGSTRA